MESMHAVTLAAMLFLFGPSISGKGGCNCAGGGTTWSSVIVLSTAFAALAAKNLPAPVPLSGTLRFFYELILALTIFHLVVGELWGRAECFLTYGLAFRLIEAGCHFCPLPGAPLFVPINYIVAAAAFYAVLRFLGVLDFPAVPVPPVAFCRDCADDAGVGAGAAAGR